MYIYVPVFVPYLNYLGGSYALAGLIVGSYGIMQTLLRLPVGVLSDMSQIRKPFIAGIFSKEVNSFDEAR